MLTGVSAGRNRLEHTEGMLRQMPQAGGDAEGEPRVECDQHIFFAMRWRLAAHELFAKAHWSRGACLKLLRLKAEAFADCVYFGFDFGGHG